MSRDFRGAARWYMLPIPEVSFGNEFFLTRQVEYVALAYQRCHAQTS